MKVVLCEVLPPGPLVIIDNTPTSRVKIASKLTLEEKEAFSVPKSK